VASDAGAFTYDLTKGSDLLIVDVTARPEISSDRLEEEVAREVDLLHAGGVTAAEVDRAVALIETSLLTSLQSAGSRADRLSLYATYFDDPHRINAELGHYRAVTAAAVSAFAAERLGPDNRVSLLYVPREDDASLDAVSDKSEVAA
jgi:predicted Zn-dependent peptidase